MKAQDLAWNAVRALAAATAAAFEVDRIRFLLKEAKIDLELALHDSGHPGDMTDDLCTRPCTFRCFCSRCDEWKTYTEWFNHATQGYYALHGRVYQLEKYLEDALQNERIAARKLKPLANEARKAALCLQE